MPKKILKDEIVLQFCQFTCCIILPSGTREKKQTVNKAVYDAVIYKASLLNTMAEESSRQHSESILSGT